MLTKDGLKISKNPAENTPKCGTRVAVLAAFLASGAPMGAHAQEASGNEVIQRMEGTRLIGGAGISLNYSQLTAEGSIDFPTFSVPVREDAEMGSTELRGALGVAFTEVNQAAGNLEQFRALVGVDVTEGGNTQTSVTACYSNVRENTWGLNACADYRLGDEATGAGIGILRQFGNRTAAGVRIERENLSEEGNTNVDLVLRHDSNFFGPTMLRTEIAVGQTLPGGLAYEQPFTVNEGATHAGARFEVTPEKYYAGPILGGEAGIAGGPYLAIQGGYAEGSARAATPYGVPAQLETNGTQVGIEVGVRF